MNIESRLEELERRLSVAEAELAIRNLITRYSLAADCGDAEAAIACHTEQAVYTVSAPCAGRDKDEAAEHGSEDLKLHGHKAIAEMLNSPLHQSLLPDCAHTVGPFCVEITANTAKAVGYSRLYRKQEEEFGLMRLSINEWSFEKQQGQWLISARESRLLGSEEAQKILKDSSPEPSSQVRTAE